MPGKDLLFFFRVKVSEEPAEQMLSTSSASPPCSVRSPFPQAVPKNPPRNGTRCWPSLRAAEKVKSAQPTEHAEKHEVLYEHDPPQKNTFERPHLHSLGEEGKFSTELLTVL